MTACVSVMKCHNDSPLYQRLPKVSQKHLSSRMRFMQPQNLTGDKFEIPQIRAIFPQIRAIFPKRTVQSADANHAHFRSVKPICERNTCATGERVSHRNTGWKLMKISINPLKLQATRVNYAKDSFEGI